MDKYNIAKIVEDALLKQLRPAIADSITNQLMKELEKDIRKIVEVETEKLVIQGVEQIKDMMDFRDELRIYLEWKNGSGKENRNNNNS